MNLHPYHQRFDFINMIFFRPAVTFKSQALDLLAEHVFLLHLFATLFCFFGSPHSD